MSIDGPVSERPKEKCGVFGIRGVGNASEHAFYGSFALQHRGEESTKIVSCSGEDFPEHGGMGLVSEVYRDFDFRELPGRMATSHNRYSTHGKSADRNIQPLCVSGSRGKIAVAHNGTFVNCEEVKNGYENDGYFFTTTVDTELVFPGIAKSRQGRIECAVAEALEPIEGSYALVMMTAKELIAARDPRGFKPLSIGRKGDAYVFASETCAFDQIGAKYFRDVEPGEIVVVGEEGLKSIDPFPEKDRKFCIFEYIYFARPDSYIFGNNSVNSVREKQGRQAAREFPIAGDVVFGVPNCAIDHARGYAKESGVELVKGFAQSFYIGRTFIQPDQFNREKMVELKLNPVKDDVSGKRVLVIEDSIVRGTTTKKRIRRLREAGAKEVHLIVACPPHRFPCYYGIDFPSEGELAANRYEKGALRDELNLDSLNYLSLQGLLSAMPGSPDDYCVSCFDGSFPAGRPKNTAGYRKV